MPEKLSQLQAEMVLSYQQDSNFWFPADHPDTLWLIANGYMTPTKDVGRYELTEKGKAYKHPDEPAVVGIDASEKETLSGKPTGNEISPVPEVSKDVKDADVTQKSPQPPGKK